MPDDRAAIKLERIAAVEERIKRKIAAGHPHSEGYKKRLARFELDKEELELQAKLDAVQARRNEMRIVVPAGGVTTEGK
jgi:hypothetical protein